jgi:hypothetical protein
VKAPEAAATAASVPEANDPSPVEVPLPVETEAGSEPLPSPSSRTPGEQTDELATETPILAKPGRMPSYVTLDQMAAVVGRKKRTLERYKSRERLPSPDVEGGDGRPHEWLWNRVRPILEKLFNRPLPEIFPGRGD